MPGVGVVIIRDVRVAGSLNLVKTTDGSGMRRVFDQVGIFLRFPLDGDQGVGEGIERLF